MAAAIAERPQRAPEVVRGDAHRDAGLKVGDQPPQLAHLVGLLAAGHIHPLLADLDVPARARHQGIAQARWPVHLQTVGSSGQY